MKKAATEIHLDPVADLRERKQNLIDQINRVYDPLIALAEETSGRITADRGARRAAASPQPTAAEPSAADLPDSATNAEWVLWALRKRGGSATITEILKTLPRRHPLHERQKPAKAISGVLGTLRGENLVVKEARDRFSLATKRG